MAGIMLDDLLNRLSKVKDDGKPDWAKLLFDCFQGVITALKENISSVAEINNLKDEIVELKDEIKSLQKSNDDNEQRGRNNCLIIHGYEEKEKEDTTSIVCDVISKELGITITPQDIMNSHRLGKRKLIPSENQRSTRASKVLPRPIIFRLTYFQKRLEIYGNKRKLKGKNLLITENLTAKRFSILKSAVEKFGKNNVWTNQGRIITKLNNKYFSFSTMDELQAV